MNESATSTINEDSTDEPKDQGRRSLATPRPRKMSIMQRLLRSTPSRLSSSASVVATLSDYGNAFALLQTVYEHLPIRGLFTGLPMLLALDAAIQGESGTDAATLQRVQAIREFLARSWAVIGRVWDCPEVVQLVEKVFNVIHSFVWQCLISITGSTLVVSVQLAGVA